VAHLDADALWAARAAEQLLKPLLDLEHVRHERKKFHDAAGFDMIDDVHAVTLYGDQFTPGQGVVIIHADVDEPPIAKLLAGQPDYKESEYAGRKVYSWTDRHHGGPHALIGCVYPRPRSSSASPVQSDVAARGRESLLLISHRRADLEKALDVLDGKTPCLADDDPLLAGENQGTASVQKAVVTIGARGLAEATLPLKSPVVRQCEILNLAVGEDSAEAHVAGRLVAKNNESAADIERVLQGVLAMGRLAGDSDKDLQKVMKTAGVSLEGKTVTFHWHGQAVDVVRAAQEQWIKKQLHQQ
jgi:hypothetical protein